MAYPLASTIYSHAATAVSPLQRGWGYVPTSPTSSDSSSSSFSYPRPLSKGEGWRVHYFPPIDTFESFHAATAVSPLKKGEGRLTPIYPR